MSKYNESIKVFLVLLSGSVHLVVGSEAGREGKKGTTQLSQEHLHDQQEWSLMQYLTVLAAIKYCKL